MNGNLFFLLVALFYSANGLNYTVIGPKIFRPGSEYRFIVSVYGAETVNYQLEAEIAKEHGHSVVKETFSVNGPGISETFSLRIPNDQHSGQYLFKLLASGDVNFNESKAIKMYKKTHSIFIQTDKYLYKPGQEVLFRVLGVQSNLKPYTEPINITIYDHSGNMIYQMLDQKNDSGIINGHLKLSDITSLGRWKIEAKSKVHTKDVYFEVAEYVLPKFEVKVSLPSFIHINEMNPLAQKNLLITVTATYTFGKPVKGYALITTRVKNRFWDDTTIPRTICKNIQLRNGKADITMTLEELRQLSDNGLHGYHDIFVKADVVEAVTGLTLQGNSSVPLEMSRLKLEFLGISSNNFKPGFPYKAYVRLSQADGSAPSPSDIKFSNASVKSLDVRVSPAHEWRFYSPENISSPVESIYSVPLTANGFTSFEVPVDYSRSAIIKVSFYDEETQDTVTTYKNIEEFFTRDKKFIQLSTLGSGETIKPRSSLTLNVKTSEDVSVIHCQILGKGGILYSNSYLSEAPCDNITFSIYIDENLALNLAPEAKVIVSFITSTGEYVADSMSLPVSDYLTNKVSLSFDRESTTTGSKVVLRVNASEDSFVSLLAVDKSVLLLRAGNEITQQMLYQDLQDYSHEYGYDGDGFVFAAFCWPIWLGGDNTDLLLKNAGVFLMTSYHLSSETNMPFYDVLESRAGVYYDDPVMKFHTEIDMEVVSSSPPSPKPARKKFPETWIWNDLKTKSDGLLEVTYDVPDTITSWITTAFATNSRYGLGISDLPAKLTVINPFFVSLNLPYSLIRGEEFSLQVTIFNYFGHDLMADVVLFASNYFKVKQCVDDVEGPPKHEADVKSIFVKDDDVATVYFWIVPTSLGQIPIEVKAEAGLVSDSIVTNILIKPEGQQQSHSQSALIRISSEGPEDPTVTEFDISLPPPDVLVPDSVTIEATLIGDIMGTTINNLDKLLQMPYGCGEQNMLTLAPDVYIIKYLNATHQLSDEINNKALGFINSGYQRQLTYQRRDGSFSAFGNNDADGSVWLSAFVMRVFHDAKGMIPVDDQRIDVTISWILDHQKPDGSFAEPPNGKVLHTAMQGGASSGISLTAYVLISLLVNRNNEVASGLQEKIDLAVSYLESRYKSYEQDPYILAIVAYAFRLAGSPKFNDVIERLGALAIHENGMTHWHKEVAGEEKSSNDWMSYHRAQSNDIEMTSYALLFTASRGDLSESITIAKWLLSKRNAEGGFESTQDTVLGLEALAMFGQLISTTDTSGDLTVKVTQDVNDEEFNFQSVNRNSALFLQSHQLPSSATKVQFIATGLGLALVQLNVKFHIKSPIENNLVTQKLSVDASNNILGLKICASWLGMEESGMVLTEVNLLTGYILADGYSDVIKDMIGSTFKRREFNSNRLSIYLDELTSMETCFIVKMKSVFPVKNGKPAVVKTYRYYAPGVVASGYYSPTSSSAAGVCDPVFNE